jgi:hypothetical protein
MVCIRSSSDQDPDKTNRLISENKHWIGNYPTGSGESQKLRSVGMLAVVDRGWTLRPVGPSNQTRLTWGSTRLRHLTSSNYTSAQLAFYILEYVWAFN